MQKKIKYKIYSATHKNANKITDIRYPLSTMNSRKKERKRQLHRKKETHAKCLVFNFRSEIIRGKKIQSIYLKYFKA